MSRYAVCFVSGAVVAATAHAGVTSLDDIFTMTVTSGDTVWTSSDHTAAVTRLERDVQGDWHVSGEWATDSWASDWSFVIHSGSGARGGPLETGLTISSLNFTNLSGVDGSFGFSVSTGATVSGPTLMSGSVSGVLVSNEPGVSTATMGVESGAFLYSALVDGSVVSTLGDETFSVSTDLLAPFGPLEFIDTPGSEVLSTLGITHELTLTGGDSVGLVGSFLVRQIPSPGAGGLFGVAALVGLRRRRSALA